MIESHIDLDALNARQLFALLMKWWVDDVSDSTISRERARELIMHHINPGSPPALDRETWGMDPDAVRGQERALRLVT